MSINEWSLVYFSTSVAFMLMTMVSLFYKLTVGKIILTIVTWFISWITTLVYGIQTQQLGFVLLFVAQLLMVFLIFIFYGRNINGNKESG